MTEKRNKFFVPIHMSCSVVNVSKIPTSNAVHVSLRKAQMYPFIFMHRFLTTFTKLCPCLHKSVYVCMYMYVRKIGFLPW